ncbi:A disintegrin and metalloproteinase with thrombospondin motifs 9 isoform X2 [Sitophilus oryzae]|uniref:A disintegrin and metalloproteinase with thrombospondin motifs 9 isoform X2 n=1 Tax=Sitophilus oryzae TaxID=7048 RepID=A0A6J2X8H4_SITOR|nr:A disintegrin and metalloproteinase with thrombospondin motifs 9 isoform X2 [Sitophilus oryzae]
MTRKRCTSALTLGAIVFLCAVVVVVWVQFSQGAFDRRSRYKGTDKTTEMGATITSDLQVERQTYGGTAEANSTKSKGFIEKTHLDDLGTEEAIFVKPLKINPDDENLAYDMGNSGHFSTEKPVVKHHSGHFRHKSAEIWDPHPKYEIDAFGKILVLELENNHNFVAPDLDIVNHGSQRGHSFKHDTKMGKCFYTGKLKDDTNSAIAVNLCHGMTGYIRSSDANYYIEPAENFTTGSLGTILHRIKKLTHAADESNDIPILEPSFDVVFKNDNGTHSIIEDDFPEEVVQTHHTIRKRDIALDEDILYDYVRNEENSNAENLRHARNTDYSVFSKASNEYFVKVLVVADRTMLEYHQTYEDLTKYILVLMSHVALLFKEPSIGNAISVSVAHIRILDYPVDNFSNSLSQDMLFGFCKWKQKHITDTSHDVALLLTRRAICKNTTSCATLGVAEVDSMCRPSGCTIVRDKGLSTSYTIAHEFGHAMSMPHDDDKKCSSHNKHSKTNNIMSRTTRNDSKPFMWSNCSRHYATEFLDSSRSNCLLNPPSRNEILSNYSQMLPGDVFAVDTQCELEYAPGFRMCSGSFNRPCGHLWCRDSSGSCHSQFSPWAEGTKCGPYSWCYKRECVAMDRRQLVPIDGDWGQWQDWGPCSRTCGGGISKSIRACDRPSPEHGGKYCTGRSARYRSCNTQDCDEKTKDFREVQCAEFNGITKSLPNLKADVEWVPKYGLGSMERSDDFCKLYCKPSHSSAYYALKDKVIDGTKCGKSGFGICVNGVCKHGGCDNRLDSGNVLDECGVCNGDNSTCQEISGAYNKTADQVSYNKVVRIPRGSSNIDVRQVSHNSDENFLALRDGETGAYILNGDQMLMIQEMEVEYGQTIIKYSGSSALVERITTLRNQKLHKDLVVEVLSIKNLSPPDITYRYLISKEAAPSVSFPSRYSWRLNQKRWSKCSSICEGTQYRKPICVDLDKGVEVHATYCDSSDVESATEKRQCNNDCSLTWNIVSRSACSPHCGTGYRRVYYNCMKISSKNQPSEIVNEKHCNVLPKPPGNEECYNPCNTTRWDYSNWTECSKTCGGGIQRRSSKCVDENNLSIDESHCSKTEKITEQICNIETCPIWRVVETSSCSAPCGGGYQNITYYCLVGGHIYDHMACDASSRPPSTKPCNEHACGRWVAENEFQPCSVTCGEGIERRRHVCKKFDSEEVLPQEYCRGIKLPRDTGRRCYRECNEITPYDMQRNILNDARRTVFQWIPGPWSACSQTCGGGVSTQEFYCRNEFGEENNLKCNPYQKPQNHISCNDQECPKWISWSWSPKCDSNCERHRQVICMDNSRVTYEDNRCNGTKPSTSEKCKLVECPHNNIPRTYFDTKDRENRYKWKVGPYKQCSTKCGKGTRRRAVECEDTLNEIIVVDSLCNYKQKPNKTTKACERFHCNYSWIEGHWSTCSTTCGMGVKTRDVTCHKVHQGGIVDPNPLPDVKRRIIHKNYCDLNHKPNSTAPCMESNCGDTYVWHAEEYKQCSHPCGKKGRQTRALSCIDVRTRQKVPRYLCPKSFKPPRKRKCNQFRCLYKSCKEIKHHMKTKENKDYIISLQGRPVKIHCYKMDTPEPQEYITLHPDKDNYAEMYDKRLMNLNSCPYDGNRRDNCHCDQISPERHGFTKFWKVGLNITSMQIIGDDFTFSKQIKGTRIPYGTAGDCYSKVTGCAQGRFSVDLTHTSFKLSPYVRWDKAGPSASADIRRTATLVQGKCGGYCGKCFPDSNYGLLVEIT